MTLPQNPYLSGEISFRQLAESANALIWVSGPDKSCSWFNPAWLNFTGRSMAQELGNGWVEGIHPLDLDKCVQRYTEKFDVREAFSMEYRLRHHDGGYRWIIDNGAPMYGDTGSFLGYVGMCWDISDRKAAEREVAEKEHLLRAIHDTAHVAIFLVDAQGIITHANQYMAALFGRTLDQLVGSEYVSLIHPNERADGRLRMMQLLDSEIQNVDLDRLYYREDGGYFWGHLNGSRLYDTTGKMMGLIGVIADIDERKRAAENLKVAATVFDTSKEGILITDAKNRIVSCNPAFTTITGYLPEDIIGRDPSLLRSGREPAGFYAAMWSGLLAEDHWEGEIWNQRKDGAIFPEWLSIALVRDAKGTVCNHIAIFSDITERKESEARIRHLAQYDFLTDLPNRALFYDRLNVALANALRYKQSFAVFFIDLDGFKPINDTHGHDIGDAVLQEVARRLSDNVRSADTVARHGGDEFVILAPTIGNEDDAGILANKILQVLDEPIRVQYRALKLSASIGISLFPHHGEDADALVRIADAAMYQVKSSGRNGWCYGQTSVR
jgi:diguanylate cyclase (GGDEF)-like protein/PAS domain S-box-containing protein